MRIFLKRGRGSITVFVTLILVPTVFFTGFLVDLARIKLYSNQAVMTADNYGSAVLSQYDNLLKELYGLFAVTQDDEGLKAVSDFEDYMKSSFDPTVKGAKVSGFMPYKSADISLGYEFIDEANLSNEDVFTTQVADFMKFRIVQVLADGEGDDVSENVVIKAIDKVQKGKKDSEASAKKVKVDEKVEKLLNELEAMYINLAAIKEYEDYFDDINTEISSAESVFNAFILSEEYGIYKDYKNNEESINAAREKKDRIDAAEENDSEENQTTETLTDEDKKYLEMGDKYDSKKSEIDEGFEALKLAIECIKEMEKGRTKTIDYVNKNGTKTLSIKYDEFKNYADDFKKAAEKASEYLTDIEKLRAELEETLESGQVSKDLKTGIEGELAWLDKLREDNYDGAMFTSAAQDICSKKTVVEAYKQQVEEICTQLDDLKTSCENAEDVSRVFLDELDMDRWIDFSKDPYSKMWSTLDELFKGTGDKNKEGNKKKDEANKTASDAMKEFEDDEKPAEGQSAPRNIPTQFNLESTQDGFDILKFSGADIFSDVSALMNVGSVGGMADEIIDNLYLVMYDTGMFSSRVTNVKNPSEESLTGIPFSDKANYVYQAELEYLLAGHYSSMNNWTDTRNRIVSFRFMMNFVSTYKIKTVSDLINNISSLIPNPIIKFAVNAALRLAVSGLETAADWSALKSGDKVVLLKSSVGDLKSIDKIEALIGKAQDESKSDSIELGYDEYVLFMLIFMTSKSDLAQRTANLIAINVSHVKQGSPDELSELSFKPENAHTAVKAFCGVHMDYAVMPKDFARRAADEDTYQGMNDFEKNSYKYTVIRGY